MILQWSAVQRCALFCALMLVVTLQYCGWAIMMYYWPSAHHYIHPATIQSYAPYAFALLCGLVLLYMLCRYYGQTTSKTIQLNLQIAVACFYAIDMSFFGYLIGSMSMMSGVVLMGAPVFGLMLIDRVAVYLAFCIGLLAMFGLTLLSLAGEIPYAPLLVNVDRSGIFGSTFWFWSMLFFLLPCLLVLIVMFDFLVMSLKKREADIRYLSEYDPLTGLYNRRVFNQKVITCWRDCLAEQHMLAVLLLDLDHFKQINDQYGHLYGDQALIKTAEVLRQQVTEPHVVGRFGGEEFVVLLVQTSVTQAQQYAEQIRQQLEAICLYSEQGDLIRIQGSIGLRCEHIQHHSNWVDMVHQADVALYHAKQSGRNRVVMSSA